MRVSQIKYEKTGARCSAGFNKKYFRMKYSVVIGIFICVFVQQGFSQTTDTVHYLPARVINGDTVAFANMNEINLGNVQEVKVSKWEERKYWKLVYNLKKVYPYAKMIKPKYEEFFNHYSSLGSDKEKRVYAKEFEKQFMELYGDELKNLTVSQGKLLNKLVYRELGKSSYTVLKEFRGTIGAIFWQTLGRLFGYNLKEQYDPNGDDKTIEEILYYIDQGLI